MTDDSTQIPNPQPPSNEGVIVNSVEMEFRASPEAVTAAEEALGDIKQRSFSGRHAELGKMINCPVCRRRHRRTEFAFREHVDENGKKFVTIEPLFSKCEQQFKQMWVDEDLETGELSIQYATVPLPGQKGTPRAILGAPIADKIRGKSTRKKPPLSATQNQVVQLTRVLFDTVNEKQFPEPAGRMLQAKKQAIATINNRREREAKRIRQQQRESRRINRRSR